MTGFQSILGQLKLWCDGTILKNPILGSGLDKLEDEPDLSPQAEREGLSLNTDLTKYFISQGIISQLGGWKQLPI